MRRPRSARSVFAISARLGILGSLVLVATISASAGSAEPPRSPRRYIPARDLVAYLEYDGLDAHAIAWRATAAHDLLVKTSAGAMLIDLIQQLTDAELKDTPVFGELVRASQITAAVNVLVRNGFTVAGYGDLDEVVFVLENLGRPENGKRLEGGWKALKPLLALLEYGFKSSRFRGRTVQQYRFAADDDKATTRALAAAAGGMAAAVTPRSMRLTAWREGDDWIVVIDHVFGDPPGKQPAVVHPANLLTAVFDRIEGKEPDVTTHPGFRSALAEGNDLKGFEPDGLFFFELKPGAIGPLALIEVVAAAGEMLLYSASDQFHDAIERALSDTEPGHPGDKLEAAANPHMKKKEDRPALADTDDPKERPSPAAGEAVQNAKPEAAKAAAPGDENLERLALAVDKSFEELEIELGRQLGLGGDRLKRIVGRWGFQGKALLSDVRIEMPSPRRGLPAWFDQPSFHTDRVPAIPPDATSFVLASFDPVRGYQTILETARVMEGDTDMFDALEHVLRDSTGLRLREDMLRHIGPTWAIVDLPGRAGDAAHGTQARRKHTVYVATVDDAGAIERVANALAGRIDERLRKYEESERKKASKDQEIGPFGMKRLPAPDRGYRVYVPSFILVDSRPGPIADSSKKKTLMFYLLIGKSSVAVATDLDSARDVVAAEGPSARPWKPAGELANAIEGLPRSLTFLSVTDPDLCGLPRSIAGLPGTIRYLTIGQTLSDDLSNKTGWTLLNVMGIPRPDQFWPRFDQWRAPTEAELRRCVFSSVLATAVDDRGYRVIHRQPLPFAGIASEIAFHQKWSIQWKGVKWPEMKYLFSVASPRFVLRP